MSAADIVSAIEMQEVTVTALRDPAQVILEGVNWTVGVGDFWVVAGLLRSGKSDLMALAAGVTRPARGCHRLFGRDLMAGFEPEHRKLRRRIGLVFDGGQLLHSLTLAENIALPFRYHRSGGAAEVEPRLRSLIEFTSLEAWAERYPVEVTRNWQQRIGLARALAMQPEVLLLDSPLTGLDPRDAAWWLDTVEKLSIGHPIMDGRPLTIVVTGDDLRPWQNRARQFAILKSRQFFPLGARSDLAGHPELLLQDLLPQSALKTWNELRTNNPPTSGRASGN